MSADPAYCVYGMSQSFFTRKLEGALAYKGIPFRLLRFACGCPEARAAGWPGGIPVVRTPDGEWAWDTTELLHHLETRAGVLRFYADFAADADVIPDPRPLPRPHWNRPFPPPGQEER